MSIISTGDGSGYVRVRPDGDLSMTAALRENTLSSLVRQLYVITKGVNCDNMRHYEAGRRVSPTHNSRILIDKDAVSETGRGTAGPNNPLWTRPIRVRFCSKQEARGTWLLVNEAELDGRLILRLYDIWLEFVYDRQGSCWRIEAQFDYKAPNPDFRTDIYSEVCQAIDPLSYSPRVLPEWAVKPYKAYIDPTVEFVMLV